MRELPRQEPIPSRAPGGPALGAPRAADLAVHARRLAAMLRVGYEEAALPLIAQLTAQVSPALSAASRRGELQQALSHLEAASLAQARGDFIAVADALEHQLAPLLDGAG